MDNKLESIGKQFTLEGGEIELTQFKNLDAKRKVKSTILDMFNGNMFRSIITPPPGLNLNRLERQKGDSNDTKEESMIKRGEMFAEKTMETISVFPSVITSAYTTLLSKEGDMVFDPFCGHNSRAEDVLSLGRKYYAYDVHTFPINFTKESIQDNYDSNDYELNLGSSAKVKYQDGYFDFSITCPPYGDVEKYSKLYKEEVKDDLSDKNYEDFLKEYSQCLSETYRVLKTGSFFVLVLGNWFKNGKHINAMGDTINICEGLGFELHDLNIYNRRSNIGGDLNYKNFILVSKRFPTIHEYIMIFKKTGIKKIHTMIQPVQQLSLFDEDEINAIMEVEPVSREGAIKLLHHKYKNVIAQNKMDEILLDSNK